MSFFGQISYLLSIGGAILINLYVLHECAKQRNQAATRYLMYAIIFTLVVIMCWLGLSLAPTAEVAFFWARIRLVAISIINIWLFHGLMHYAELSHYLRGYRSAWLWIIPVVNLFFSLFDPSNPLYFREWRLVYYELIKVEVSRLGGWHLIVNVYYLIVIFITIGVFARLYRHASHRFNAQMAWVVGGILLGVTIGSFNGWGIVPPGSPNPTPIGSLLGSLMIARGLWSAPLSNVTPLAHELVFQNMTEAVIVTNHSQVIVDLNHHAKHLFPDEHEVFGKPLHDFPCLAFAFENIQHENEVKILNRFYQLSVSRIQPNPRQHLGYVFTLTDITKLKEQELERERLLLTLDAYARTVAHDLKNPVSVISGYLELAQIAIEKYPENDKLVSYLDRAKRGTETMTGIINSLLLLATLRQTDSLTFNPLNMLGIIKSVLDRLELTIAQTQAIIELPESLPIALGYANWVEEIWLNYLSNAIKYGGTPPLIRISSISTETHILYRVHDNGVGLQPEERKALFKDFSRLKRHEDKEGHGLGLVIVRQMVERMSGSVAVESEVGKGSTFSFSLPKH